MRIVSLHPACTEWVAAFGALGDLVGRSHACGHIETASGVPAVTRTPSAPAEPRQQEQTEAVSATVDEKLIAELTPDVILAAEGVSTRNLDMEGWPSGRKPAILQLNPTSYKEVLDGALRLGKMIGRLREAMRYIGETEKNLLMLQRRLPISSNAQARPSAVCLESFNPLRFSGRWVPDLVELAGGRPLHPQSSEGDDSWDDLMRLDPDVLAFAPPHGGIDAARRGAQQMARMEDRQGFRAGTSIRIIAFDGTLFSIPGPRLYRAVELLAAALHRGRSGITPHPTELARVRTSSLPAK